MNDILVVKINFACDRASLNEIYENILRQMDQGLVTLPYGYDALVVSRECDVKVEKCTQKDNVYNNCNTCKHRKTPRNFNKCLMCHNGSNYEEDDDNHGC